MYWVVYWEFSEKSDYYNEYGESNLFRDEGFAWDWYYDCIKDGVSYVKITQYEVWRGQTCDEEMLQEYTRKDDGNE